MIIGINAGHGIFGSKSIGAKSTILCESTENREVVKYLTKILTENNCIVVDCTIDYPSSATDCINKIVSKANAQPLDLFVSIHFNAGSNNLAGNSVTTGTEVYTYSATSSSNSYATRIVDNVAELGFRNRGVKHNTTWGVLRSTQAPAVLVECCFVDDKDDVDLYKNIGAFEVAKKIAEGILNKKLTVDPTPEQVKYGVNVHSFGSKDSATNFQKLLKDNYNAYSEVYEIKG